MSNSAKPYNALKSHEKIYSISGCCEKASWYIRKVMSKYKTKNISSIKVPKVSGANLTDFDEYESSAHFSKWRIPTVNRTAVVITFKPKFLKWVNALPDFNELKFTLGMLNKSKPVYLIPDYEDEEESLEWFIPMQSVVLDEAFSSVCTDPTLWPEGKSKFDDYLTAEFHDLVFDLEVSKTLKREKS